MGVLRTLRLPNGFLWVPVHYSHDPEKNNPEWIADAQRAFPRPSDWDKEYEIDFQSVAGTPAYPRFDEAKHTARDLPYFDRMPLRLAFDFNADPMSLIVSQIHLDKKLLLTLREFVYAADIDTIVNDFRNAYPAHRSDIIVYGDATTGTTAQTAKSNWDIVRLGFRGYHVQPSFRLPTANPRIGDRLNAVNRILQGEGPVTTVIDMDTCPELLRDLREVLLTKDRKKILKVTDRDDPYFFRTHASDAWGYMIYREFPVVGEIIHTMGVKRKPLEYDRLLGEVDWGKKERAERDEAIRARKRRREMDRSNAR